MKLHQIETLAEAYCKAYYENDLLGIRPALNGDIEIHLTRNGLENLVGTFSGIYDYGSLYMREFKVGRFKFYCCLEEQDLTEQDKKELRLQDEF